jgi:hypothetical protein
MKRNPVPFCIDKNGIITMAFGYKRFFPDDFSTGISNQPTTL